MSINGVNKTFSPLLSNAVASIRLGSEDLLACKEDPNRVLSAIRNIYSGVLLLCKEVLRQLSPEDNKWIRSGCKIQKSKDGKGELKLVNINNVNTISRFEIGERFKFADLRVSFEKIDKIASIRNKVEHYYSDHSQAEVEEAISNAYLVISEIMEDHLKQDPFAVFGDGTWEIMVEIDQVFKEALDHCNESFSNIDWETGTHENAIRAACCSYCGSPLIKQVDQNNNELNNAQFQCYRCRNLLPNETIINEAIAEYLQTKYFISVKDGGEPPYGECPECGGYYVFDDKRCVMCKFEQKERKCARCSNSLTFDQIQEFGWLCSYCHWTAEKIRDE